LGKDRPGLGVVWLRAGRKSESDANVILVSCLGQDGRLRVMASTIRGARYRIRPSRGVKVGGCQKCAGVRL
jgi:hypothetical protein